MENVNVRKNPGDSGDRMDAAENEEWKLPSLPAGYAIIFRCRDCEYRWRLEAELPALVKVFYDQNKRCYSCNSTSIEMDIVPTSSE